MLTQRSFPFTSKFHGTDGLYVYHDRGMGIYGPIILVGAFVPIIHITILLYIQSPPSLVEVLVITLMFATTIYAIYKAMRVTEYRFSDETLEVSSYTKPALLGPLSEKRPCTGNKIEFVVCNLSFLSSATKLFTGHGVMINTGHDEILVACVKRPESAKLEAQRIQEMTGWDIVDQQRVIRGQITR